MITITYNGKKYEPAKYENNTIGKELQSMINIGYLEEVKENKEDVLSIKQENPHDKIKIVTPRGETIHINYDFMPSDTSILEKLREELNRRIKDYKELEESVESDRLAGDFFIKRREVEGILYYLTSLETKENKEPTWVDDLQGISKLIEEDVKKEQFTPGQEEPEELFRTCKCDGCKDDVVWLEPNMDEGIPNNMTTTTRERFTEEFGYIFDTNDMSAKPINEKMLSFIETIEKEAEECMKEKCLEKLREREKKLIKEHRNYDVRQVQYDIIGENITQQVFDFIQSKIHEAEERGRQEMKERVLSKMPNDKNFMEEVCMWRDDADIVKNIRGRCEGHNKCLNEIRTAINSLK